MLITKKFFSQVAHLPATFPQFSPYIIYTCGPYMDFA